MDKTLRVFHSSAEADAADRAFYKSLTAKERLDILLQLIEDHQREHGGVPDRIERVIRVVHLKDL